MRKHSNLVTLQKIWFLAALAGCLIVGVVVGAYGATRYWTPLIIEGQRATDRALDQTERALEQADRFRETVEATLDDSEEGSTP